MSDIVNKLWGFCHTLRHDGIDYGDYIEQLTYLLFLKMSDEKSIKLPKDCDWNSLKEKSGTELVDHYSDMLRKLREQPGILGDIFAQATHHFTQPVNLKKIINMIDEENWSALDVDVKGAAFEGLLERAASEGKKGAGQYFTPRVLIQSIVRLMKPDPRGKPGFKICDPACGTGGFLVCAYEWLIQETIYLSGVVQAALGSRADLNVRDTELEVVLAPMSSPHRSRAVAALCDELHAEAAVFPGSNLRLRYRVAAPD